MESAAPSDHDLAEQVAELQIRLEEANETLDAIRRGDVDALVGAGPEGDQLFTLKGADDPYRVLIEEMNQGAVTLSAGGSILYCNRRFCELLDVPLEEILGSDFTDLVARAERGDFLGLLESGRARASTAEIMLAGGSGDGVPLRLAVAPLPTGSAAAICLVATDISESRSVEAELKSREARLAEAQQLAHLGSWELDLQTGIVTWSDELYRINGLDRAVFTPSERDSNLNHPEDRGWITERVDAAREGAGTFNHNHRIVRADGTERWVHACGRTDFDTRSKRLPSIHAEVRTPRVSEFCPRLKVIATNPTVALEELRKLGVDPR